MDACGCQGLQHEVAGNRVVLVSRGGTVTMTCAKDDGGQVKIEHLECQSCQTVYVANGEPADAR